MLVDEYDAFLIDLDGVVYVGSEPVSGAVETIGRLRDRGVPLRFVTNNSSQTRAEIRARLDGLGVDAATDEIVSAAWATGQYLRDAGLDRAFVVGTDSLRAELRDAGVTVSTPGTARDGSVDRDRDRDRDPDPDPDAAVVGHSTATDYWDLTAATRLVYRAEVPIVAVNADAAVPKPDGPVPGVGAIVSAIETATDRTATVVGKPEPRLFEYATAALDAEAVAMVGDSPAVDVRGAVRAGLGAVLVTAHATRGGEGPTPDATITDLRGLFGD